MTKKKTRFVGILAGTAALAIAGSGGTALADRDHPEDGPDHGTHAEAGTLKHYDGTVLSTQRSPKELKLRTEGGQERKFRVNAKTRFERLSGFRALDRGLAVEVDAKRTEHGLVARQVENAGAGGGGGADDPAGDDNGSGGDGADDPAGDDNGSGGDGADDGPNHT